jgi:hypothetical protein
MKHSSKERKVASDKGRIGDRRKGKNDAGGIAASQTAKSIAQKSRAVSQIKNTDVGREKATSSAAKTTADQGRDKATTAAKTAAHSTSRAETTRQNLIQGENAERKGVKALKNLGFERTGLGLHYGRQGLDVYGIRNTPRGRTLARMEVKSTRDPRKQNPQPNQILRLLKHDKNGMQQGSRLYGEDRLLRAVRSGSPVARNIRSGQAHTRNGRVWQARDYVHWVNVATGEEKTFRAIPNQAGNEVKDLREIHHKLPWEQG